MKQRYFSFLLLTLFLACSFAYAGGPGTTGAAFLKIGIGARNIGMGETGSVSEDANSIYWNPAGLAGISKKEISLMYGMWLETINYNHLAFALPLSFGTIGVGGNLLTMGSMDRYDNTGAKVIKSDGNTDTFTASDMAVILSYAKSLKAGNMPLNVGFNLKYISSAIDTQNATAFGTDIGAQLKVKGEKMKIGLALQNIGSGLNYKVTANSPSDPLPMNIKTGIAYDFKDITKGGTLAVGLDVNFPSDNDARFNLGTEYLHRFGQDMHLAGRLGYRSNTKGLTGLAGPTIGVGFGIGSYSLDWAFVPYGQLGDTHRISFSARF